MGQCTSPCLFGVDKLQPNKSTNSIESRMTYEPSCCSALTFIFFLLLLYFGMFQSNCQCWLLSHKSCACQTLNAPGSSIESRGEGGLKNKRAAVWVIISVQRQRYGINRLLLLTYPSAPIIGGFFTTCVSNLNGV